MGAVSSKLMGLCSTKSAIRYRPIFFFLFLQTKPKNFRIVYAGEKSIQHISSQFISNANSTSWYVGMILPFPSPLLLPMAMVGLVA